MENWGLSAVKVGIEPGSKWRNSDQSLCSSPNTVLLLCGVLIQPLRVSSAQLSFHLQGPECVQYLQQEYLPSLQVAPEIIQVRALLTDFT